LVEADYELQPRDEADADGQLHDLDALDEQAALAERFGAAHASAITTPPSVFQNAYVSEEEQGMEMRPAIVGPPAYGSPDPLTQAGKLLPLEQHPLRMDALPEDHPAAISEDYGEGYDHTLKGAATVQSQPNVAASDLDRHSVGDFTQEQLAERNADVDATDSARDLAAEEGVDLNDVEGTGEGGRVTKADVESYLSEQD
jgi:pyruvate/2-oxoglutarate dehydrogenase complex dihydrolipoamide acyltransferase (E2) component